MSEVIKSVPPGSQNTSQWIISKDQLVFTPSALDGIPLDQEEIQRSKGCNFIINVGLRLKLPQTALATANIYFHRFYLRFSLKNYHYYEVAATCIFLATKVEDSVRKLRDIVINCAKVAQKNSNVLVDEQTKEYWRWRDVILYTEEVLLEALCFDFTVEHPYPYVLSFIKKFVADDKNVTKVAWTYINDSTRSIACLLYSPKTIAAAAFQFALEKNEINLSTTTDGLPVWMEESQVSYEDVKGVLTLIDSLYKKINPSKQALPIDQKNGSHASSVAPGTPSSLASVSTQATPQHQNSSGRTDSFHSLNTETPSKSTVDDQILSAAAQPKKSSDTDKEMETEAS
ncbi:Cyclin pch1 [Schizosaccharomyces pombe]